MLSEETKKKIHALRGRYRESKSALIPGLFVAQEELGHLPNEALVEIAQLLEISPVEVYEAVTFYTMFNLEPTGKYKLNVCTSLSCFLVGVEKILNYLEQKLGIEVNETTQDGKFTLKEVECLGSCGTAPMMQVNKDYYENLTEKRIDEILEGLP
ncbi:MAG: NADH-quinone oxidoreductase subunit NuoE [Candidatus Tectomicrobia bacterium]|nr:NADH-quinone oxidoreductase subunit NuoE [Candidatus Tectomicrobia bacterium]